MKLDLGGGVGARPEGFTRVDINGGEVIWDLAQAPYPWPDNSVEAIHCSHTLEHLWKKDAYVCLQESFRILQPGGVITIAVPDMDVGIDGHLTGDWSRQPHLDGRDLNLCLGGNFPADSPWRHKYLYCWESLAYMLEKTGFVGVVRHGHDDGPYQHLFGNPYNPDYRTSSLYVTAVKPRG